MKKYLKKIHPFAYFLAGAALLFIIDIVTKWIVQNSCKKGVLNEVIPNFWYITLSYNTGIAFGLKIEGVWGRVLNISISLIMSGVILGYWIYKRKKFNKFASVIAMLMFAGAIGNLIDRAFYWSGTTGFDGVIDFMQFYLGGGPSKPSSFLNPFATFNLADAYLVIGVILLIVYMIIDAIKHRDRSLEVDPRLKEKPQEKAGEENEAND